MLEALFIEADRRVRRRLLELGNEYRDEAGLAAIPLTQEDLAALAGTSRATVSRVLADEERRGTIMKRRRLGRVDRIARVGTRVDADDWLARLGGGQLLEYAWTQHPSE